MILSRWILLGMRNISYKSYRENQNTHFMFGKFFSRKSCSLCDNLEKYCTAGQATDDNIIRRMRFAWWINKATEAHTKYVILIAFRVQYWLHERASMLRYMYIAFLYIYEITSHSAWPTVIDVHVARIDTRFNCSHSHVGNGSSRERMILRYILLLLHCAKLILILVLPPALDLQ
jgi:hypothetical protein